MNAIGFRTVSLMPAMLLLATPASAQASTYPVWGTYNFLRVEMRLDEDAGFAHIRMTNNSANVIELSHAPFAHDAIAPYRGATMLPFRGLFISPKRDPVTLAPLTVKLKPGQVMLGKVELVQPDPADGYFTHWCYANTAWAHGDAVFLSLCAPAGSKHNSG